MSQQEEIEMIVGFIHRERRVNGFRIICLEETPSRAKIDEMQKGSSSSIVCNSVNLRNLHSHQRALQRAGELTSFGIQKGL